MSSKIGNTYTYISERDMLDVANRLEAEGYKVIRKQDGLCFKVTVIGYR